MTVNEFRSLFLGGLKTDFSFLCDIECQASLTHVIRRAIAAALSYEKVRGRVYVSVQICDAEHIRELNRTYRQKDTSTDVLSFPLWERDELPQKGTLELGDIVISYPRAEEQARELGHSTERELAFLSVHSTLHLLGYDHESSAEEDEDMCRRQKAIISKLKIKE